MIEWKKIQGYNYEVSNTGEVRNIVRGKTLKKSIHDKRYYRINLSNDGVNKSYLVHRLVAEYFCEKKLGLDIVHHLDGNGFNNNADNLIWTTQAINVKFAFEGDKIKNDFRVTRRGKGNPNYKHGRYCKHKYLSVKKKKTKRVWD